MALWFVLPLCVVMCLSTAIAMAKWGMLVVRTAYAEKQLEVFYNSLESCDEASAQTIAEHRHYVLGYYPSGTRQVRGTRLDRIVEMVREDVVRQLDARLADLSQKNENASPESPR